MRLLLLRHAQTPSNVKALLDTEVPGPGLTDVGHQQAQRLVERMADHQPTAVFVSNMVRTHLTAEPLVTARGLQVHERDGIREISAGDLCMASDLPSALAYRDVIAAWAQGDLGPRLPGGEHGSDVLDRFDSVVEEARRLADPCALIVSHGAMIRTWVGARGANLDSTFIAENYLDNTDLVVMDRVGADWHVREWAGRAI